LVEISFNREGRCIPSKMALWVNLSLVRGSKECRKIIKCTTEQTVGDILSNEFDQGERISKVVGAASDMKASAAASAGDWGHATRYLKLVHRQIRI
jgi:hypothetical protein